MSKNKMIYIASPYAGDIEKNVQFAKDSCHFAMEQGHTPVAVHLLYTQFLRDDIPAERTAGLRMGHHVLSKCDELWICGSRISNGMAAEIEKAKELDIPIKEISEAQILGENQQSQKYGVWAVRSAGSVCGAAQSWCKNDGVPLEFSTIEKAHDYASHLNETMGGINVRYYSKEMEQELAHVSEMTMKM